MARGEAIRQRLLQQCTRWRPTRAEKAGFPATCRRGVDSALVIQHRSTSQNLCADPGISTLSDFGNELEVCCNLATQTGKSHQLVSEFSGLSTGDTAARSEKDTSQWRFICSKDPSAAQEFRNLPTPLSAEALKNKVREIVNKRGNHGIRGLARSFAIMDDGGDKKLDRDDFKWGLYDYGVHLDDDQFGVLLDDFDTNDDGYISFDEFLVAIRGPLNARRLGFIDQAYDLLDRNGDELVTVDDLAAAYDCSQHPSVASGEKSDNEVLREFMSMWDTGTKDYKVTRDEFRDYYKDVSASIDDDDYFELMMRNAWHISGGEGSCANTSCRRVLVIHNDSSQEVVEIENDLGIDDEDIAGMIARLEQQGITDIKEIKLSA